MARIRPTGAGQPRRAAATNKRKSGKRKAQRAAHHASTARQAMAPTLSAEHTAAGSAWSGMTAPSASLTPLLALHPDQASAALATLTLAGAQRASPQDALHQALQAWGAAQDQAASRMWRRPGGLTRMAGL